MPFSKLIPEKRSHKIAAIYEDKSVAEKAEQTLVQGAHFSDEDVFLVDPDDTEAHKKLEPEADAIATTLLTTHFIFGSLGLVTGLVAAFIFSLSGPLFAQSSPFLLHLALGMVGLFFGLFFAGALTLRPDHDPLINETLEASRLNRWTLIVQASNRRHQQKARQMLMPEAISVTDTF